MKPSTAFLIRDSLIFISHYVQMKPVPASAKPACRSNFISHYVQMKPRTARRFMRGIFLYIPLRSDETEHAKTVGQQQIEPLYPTTFR